MVIIPFIFFLVLLVFNIIRTRSFNLGSFLLLIYGISALLSFFLYNVEFLVYKNIEIKLSAVVFYCVVLTVFFFPFLSKSQTQHYKNLLPDLRLFNFISVFFIVINLFSILALSKAMAFVFSHDPSQLRDGGMRRIYSFNTIENAAMWILGHFSDFYLLLLVFFFYSKTYLKNSTIFNTLLLVASMSTIVNGLMSGGRTQIIYWTLVFISCFIYFRRDMPKRSRRQLIRFSLLLFSLLVSYLTFITIFRFSNAFSGATDYDEAFSLLDYSGQIFLNFDNFFVNFQHKGYTVARVFPILYDFFADTNFDLMVYKRSIPMDIGVFSTFLGDMYIDMGILGIVIYGIVYLTTFIGTQRSRISGTKKLQQVLLYFMLFQVPLNGLFYYSVYNKTATISVIGTIIISLLFRFSEKETIEVANTENA